jgi:hypothetical protein
MSVTRDQYEIARLRLRQARRAMRAFAEMSADLTHKVILDEAYASLPDDLRQFGRCQHGLEEGRKGSHD